MKNRLYMQLQNITTTLSPSCQVLQTKTHASIFPVVHQTKWNYGYSVEWQMKQIMTPLSRGWMLTFRSPHHVQKLYHKPSTPHSKPLFLITNHDSWNLWQTSFYFEEHYSGKNDKHKSMKGNWRYKYWSEWLEMIWRSMKAQLSSVLVTTLWHGSIYTWSLSETLRHIHCSLLYIEK